MPEDRIATFDQDGTTWVEQPIYSQVLFAFDRVAEMAPQHPEWKTKMPFKAIVTGDKEAMGKFTLKDIEVIAMATHTGMTAEAFTPLVTDWMAKAKHPRFDKPYPQMVYQPMLEVMKYLRDNGYRTYIVTGGGQDFVRAYSQTVYGIPPEQIIGSALDTQYAYNKEGQGILMRDPKLLLNNNGAGKPRISTYSSGSILRRRLATPTATGRCWSTPRQMAEPHWRCSCCTMMPHASMRMARRRVCLTPRSALSLSASMTRPRRKAGP